MVIAGGSIDWFLRRVGCVNLGDYAWAKCVFLGQSWSEIVLEGKGRKFEMASLTLFCNHFPMQLDQPLNFCSSFAKQNDICVTWLLGF